MKSSSQMHSVRFRLFAAASGVSPSLCAAHVGGGASVCGDVVPWRAVHAIFMITERPGTLSFKQAVSECV